jgi:hypothetical protein
MKKNLAIFAIVAIVIGVLIFAYQMVKPKNTTCKCQEHSPAPAEPVSFPQFVDPYVGTEPSYKPVEEIDFLAELESLEA